MLCISGKLDNRSIGFVKISSQISAKGRDFLKTGLIFLDEKALIPEKRKHHGY